MRKIFYLSLLCLFLLGCNLNVKKIEKAFKFKNKINYVLNTEGYDNCEDYIDSLNLQKYERFYDIDYSYQYYVYENFYFFQIEDINVIMRDIDDYVCLKNNVEKLKVEDFHNLKIGKDTIFNVVDLYGLPMRESGSGQIFQDYIITEDDYRISIDISCTYSSSSYGKIIIQLIYVNKEWY